MFQQQRQDHRGGDRDRNYGYERRGPPRHYDDQRGGSSSGGRRNDHYGGGEGSNYRQNRDYRSDRNAGGGDYGNGYRNSDGRDGYDSRKRHADDRDVEAPSAKQLPMELGTVDADIIGKINGQLTKMNYKDVRPENVAELQEIIVFGELESCEPMKNELALFLGKTAGLLAKKGVSICSPPQFGTIPSSKNLISVASALLSTCSFLQMTGEQLQILEAPICDRICEMHLELDFTLLDLESLNCKALTKWLLGKKSKRTNKKLFVRSRCRTFTLRWISIIQTDSLDNQYQILFQCNYDLHEFSQKAGSNHSMTLEMRQIGRGEYLLSKYPMEQANQKPEFALNGPVTKLTFTNSMKPS